MATSVFGIESHDAPLHTNTDAELAMKISGDGDTLLLIEGGKSNDYDEVGVVIRGHPTAGYWLAGTDDTQDFQIKYDSTDYNFTDTSAFFTVRTNGNVGIGTNEPANKLHVHGNIQIGTSGNNESKYLRLFRGGINALISMYNMHLFINCAQGISLSTNNQSDNPEFKVASEANVGIGTNSPQSKLNIFDASKNTMAGGWSPSPLVRIFQSSEGTIGPTHQNTFFNNTMISVGSRGGSDLINMNGSSTYGMVLGTCPHPAIGLKMFNDDGSKPQGKLELVYDMTSQSDMKNVSDDDKQVVIDSNGDSWFNGGNVGIGTTSPDAKLDIGGDGSDIYFSSDTNISRKADYDTYYSSKTNSIIRYADSQVKYSGGGADLNKTHEIELGYDMNSKTTYMISNGSTTYYPTRHAMHFKVCWNGRITWW